MHIVAIEPIRYLIFYDAFEYDLLIGTDVAQIDKNLESFLPKWKIEVYDVFTKVH